MKTLKQNNFHQSIARAQAKQAAVAKKAAPKKMSPKPVKKAVVKKVVKPVPQKEITQKKVEPILKKPVVKKVAKPEIKKVKKVAQEKVEEPEAVYVTHKEFSVLQLQDALQEAVIQVWNPPAGMPDTTECSIKIALDWNGNIIESSVEKSSGILIYDMTVEHAVPIIKFPHAAYGKTFTVSFKL